MSLTEKEFKNLFNAAPFIAALLSREGTILACNAKFVKTACDTKVFDPVGENIKEYFNEGVSQKDIRKLHTAVLSGVACYGVFATFIDCNKHKRRMKTNMLPLMNEGTLLKVLITCEDITEQEKERKRLQYHSFHDELTGLYNRALFDEEVSRLDVERYLPLSVCSVDIDALKFVNDVFGHVAGDELLKSVAKCLSKTVRSNDILARVGGDEFLVLLPGVDEGSAHNFAQRVRDTLSTSNIRGLPVAASIGIATKVSGDENFLDVLAKADGQMYANKFAVRRKVRNTLIRAVEENLFQQVSGERDAAVLTGALAAQIAKEMGEDNKTIGHIARVGRYADIGKACVGINIFNKMGELSEDERLEVQSHTLCGYAMLNASADLRDLAEEVYCHHERPDGKGYPRGLTASSIPLGSKVVAVAEAVVSMKYGWPGSARLKKDEIIHELKEGANTQFDVRACEACIRVLERGEFEAD